jgi:membrane protease YdiL (CAAX protease family)
MSEPLDATATTSKGPEQHAHSVPWTTRDVFWAILLGAFVLVGLLFVLIVASEVIALATGADSSTGILGSLVLIAELGLLLPVWALGIRKYHVPWSTLGFRGFEFGKSLGLGCLFLLFALGFNVFWALFMAAFDRSVQPDLSPLVGESLGGLSVMLLGAGIIAPAAEEAFFRGFVFSGLRRSMRLVPAAALSAALFAVVHITPTSWPPIFVLGVLFALLYEQTGSVWPAVIMHGLINSMAFLLMYLSQALARP